MDKRKQTKTPPTDVGGVFFGSRFGLPGSEGLLEAGGLAVTVAEVVELCASDFTLANDLDAGDGGRVDREGSLDADAIGDTADGDGLGDAAMLDGVV